VAEEAQVVQVDQEVQEELVKVSHVDNKFKYQEKN